MSNYNGTLELKIFFNIFFFWGGESHNKNSIEGEYFFFLFLLAPLKKNPDVKCMYIVKC